MSEIKNEWQTKLVDLFMESFDKGCSELVFITNCCRQYGKTTVINELSLIFQSMGYKVGILTDHPNQTRYGTFLVDIVKYRYRGIRGIRELKNNKVAILVDEFEWNKQNYDWINLKEYLENNMILTFGFIY